MAKLTITGQVLVRASHQGVAGVVARAVWVLDGSLLSAIALVAVMAACGHGQASRVCREEAPGQCRGCDTPSRLSAAEQQAQGTAAVASLIAAERKTGLLTDAVGGDLALRYFRVEPATLWDRGGDHEPVVMTSPRSTPLPEPRHVAVCIG